MFLPSGAVSSDVPRIANARTPSQFRRKAPPIVRVDRSDSPRKTETSGLAFSETSIPYFASELLRLFHPAVLDHLVDLVTVGELGALLEPASGEDDEDGGEGGDGEAERPPADGEQQVDGPGRQDGADRPAGLDE